MVGPCLRGLGFGGALGARAADEDMALPFNMLPDDEKIPPIEPSKEHVRSLCQLIKMNTTL